MPDPQVVYVVTAIVVLGLVAWVAFVLWRVPKRPPVVPSAADVQDDRTASPSKPT